jgi:hypothetical protein
MDRYDEKRDRTDELMVDRERDERELADERDREPVRQGDILGLGGIEVPKAPGDPTTEHDPQSVAQRRSRALADEPPAAQPVDPTKQGGATGIDMGSGGQGTLLRRPKS